MINGVLVDPYSFTREVGVENTLEAYYELLGCDCFDIASVWVGNKRYDVYCDDEGAFKEHPKPTVLDASGKIRILGKCFFTATDSAGETISLSKSQIKNLLNHVRLMVDHSDCTYYEVIVCDRL